MERVLKIGSRGSPLALKQVEMVREALAREFPELETELVVITTSGDWKPEDGEVRLEARAGGKAQFAKEIEEALLAGEIDAAVHSMKDMDSFLPEGLVIDHMLPREDVRDCLLFSSDLSKNSQFEKGGLSTIPEGAVIGTTSVRRGAFIKAERPDVNLEVFRGNVQTRIDKVSAGQVDVTMLAMAGLKRLGIAGEADVVLDVDAFLPAAAQGAVGIEVRADDEGVLSIFGRISDLNTVLCVKSERSALRALNGGCHSPIAAYAVMDGDEMWLRVRVASEDGAQVFEDEIRGDVRSVKEAQKLGQEIGSRMKEIIPAGILKD
jgi:hydroxymethylbilane synthase